MGDVMREAYKRNWITTRDGNCAVRIKDSNIIHMTPSGVRKTLICPEMICRVVLGEELNFQSSMNLNVTGEWEMHYLILKDAPTTIATVHLHPPNIVAAMYAGWDLKSMALQFPEIYRYTKVGPNVPVLPAISQALADETSRALGLKDGKVQYDVVGQGNHGVCSVGQNPWDAFEHIERLEHICQIVLNSGVRPSIINTMPV